MSPRILPYHGPVPEALDVTSLRIVRAIADRGTITAAAVSLGYSQPAVSQHIRRLERRLGTALLERTGRRIRLTEAGEVLARHGTTVSSALDAAAAEVASLAGLRAGRVRLVAFPSSSASIVPAALALLRERHPNVQVTFEEAEPPESLESLGAGACDIALGFTYPPTGSRGATAPAGVEGDLARLVVRHLLDDSPVLALPAGDPAADQERLHLRDLADRTWIAGCPRCRGHLLRACEESGFTPDIAYATDDYVAVLALVAARLGVALVPGLVRPTAIRHPGVVAREVEGTSRRSVYAVTTPDLHRVPAVRVMLDALAEASAALPVD